MRVEYRDANDRDRSSIVRRVIELHRWLPERFAETVSWRASEWFARRAGSEFKWAQRVALDGDGRLNLRGKVRIGSGTLISVAGDRTELSFGENLFIDRNTTVFAYGPMEVGSDIYFGTGTYFDARGGLRIGSRVQIGPGTKIVTFNHALESGGEDSMEGVTVGNDVWIGANCVVLDGTVIGDGAVVAAGAVVRGNVPGGVVVGGVPARVLKTIAR